MNLLRLLEGFSYCSVGKESACNAGDPGLIPGSGWSPWEGNGNPFPYSCLENPVDRGVWWAIVHEGTRFGHDLATKPPRLLDNKLMWKIQWYFSVSATDSLTFLQGSGKYCWEILLQESFICLHVLLDLSRAHGPDNSYMTLIVRLFWHWELLRDEIMSSSGTKSKLAYCSQ